MRSLKCVCLQGNTHSFHPFFYSIGAQKQRSKANSIVLTRDVQLVFQEHCVFCDWIIVKCHKFISNLRIVINGWTRETAPLTAFNNYSLTLVINMKLTYVQLTIVTLLSDVHSLIHDNLQYLRPLSVLRCMVLWPYNTTLHCYVIYLQC